jgi:hypothetical protein
MKMPTVRETVEEMALSQGTILPMCAITSMISLGT